MATHAVSREVSIDNFISELRKFPEAAFNGTEEILSFMTGNPVAVDSLAPYLIWDSQHYTRNLVDKTRLFELVAICWEVGQTSSVHNHRDQNCWMAAPLGRLLVENYKLISQDLMKGRCNLNPAETVEMDASHPCAVNPLEPVHRVLNPREYNQRAVTLHVYSRPFDTCVVYSPEQSVCGEIKLHYTSEYGKPVKERLTLNLPVKIERCLPLGNQPPFLLPSPPMPLRRLRPLLFALWDPTSLSSF